MNLTFSAFNSHKYPKIPNELTSLVLIVNKDTLLGNFYSDDQEAISYETVMKKILLPYFKIKVNYCTFFPESTNFVLTCIGYIFL